jgi:hypothetical protein
MSGSHGVTKLEWFHGNLTVAGSENDKLNEVGGPGVRTRPVCVCWSELEVCSTATSSIECTSTGGSFTRQKWNSFSEGDAIPT